MDDRLGEFAGDVLVADGKIEQVAPWIDAGDVEVVDAAGLPGPARLRRFPPPHLAEPDPSHRHRLGPAAHVRRTVQAFRSELPAEDVYAATLFGRLAALDAGVTTLLDWAHIQNSPEHADEAVRALREVGGRTVYAHGQPGIEPERWMKESTLPHPADIRRLREHVLASDDALVTLAMAARGP